MEAITKTESLHGPPWSRRLTIPAGTRVTLRPATNQPAYGLIQFWMTGYPDRPLVEDDLDERLINGPYGIGFGRDEVEIIENG